MHTFVKLAPLALIVCATGNAAAQTQYVFNGSSSFIQDLDPNDGVDLIATLPGTWSGAFEIDPDSLSLISNSQNQGGSFTRYSGIVLNNLSLQTTVGELVVTDTDVNGILTLWDRANFGSGQKQISLIFDVNGSDVQWLLAVNAGHPLYDNLFNVGTPAANSYKGLSDFVGDPGLLSSLFNQFSIDGDTPVLPGRGRYFGSTENLDFIPSPGGLALFSMCGVAAIRRRR